MTLRPIPPDERAAPVRPDLGRFGMRLFLAALSMLFAASLVGMLVVRSQSKAWPPPDAPDVPGGMWLSTALILLSSVTVALALRAVRRHEQRGVRLWLATTLALGVGFLAAQTLNWLALVEQRLTATSNLYGFTFFLLTGLHAVHVIGGLVALGLATRGAFRGRYSAFYYAPMQYVASYWHFLDVVWLVLFAVLLVTG